MPLTKILAAHLSPFSDGVHDRVILFYRNVERAENRKTKFQKCHGTGLIRIVESV